MSNNTFTHAGLTLTLPTLADDAPVTSYCWDSDLENTLGMDLADLTIQFREEFMEAVTLEVVKPLLRDDRRRQTPRTGIVLVTVAGEDGRVMAGFVASRSDHHCDTPYSLTDLDAWNFNRKEAARKAKPAKRNATPAKPAKRKKLKKN